MKPKEYEKKYAGKFNENKFLVDLTIDFETIIETAKFSKAITVQHFHSIVENFRNKFVSICIRLNLKSHAPEKIKYFYLKASDWRKQKKEHILLNKHQPKKGIWYKFFTHIIYPMYCETCAEEIKEMWSRHNKENEYEAYWDNVFSKDLAYVLLSWIAQQQKIIEIPDESFELLKIEATSTEAEINSAFRKQLMETKAHPDHGGSEDVVSKLITAKLACLNYCKQI